MATQVSLLDGALASAGTLAIQTNGTTNAITISSAQVATFVNNPIMTGLTASRAVFTDGSKGLTSNAITGTGNVVMSASPTLTGTISGAAITLSSDLTLSGGTANGVLYLNGSKVATSGSALVFDGSNLGVGASPSGAVIRAVGSSGRLIVGDTSANYYDADTQIWRTFGLSEQMRLTSTGLGIGTSSPSYKLDVNRGSSGVVARFTGGGAAAFVYADSSQVYYGAAAGVPNCLLINEGSNYLTFNTNGSERARIDSSGNMGIGTTSPTTRLSITDSAGPVIRLVRTSNRFEVAADNDYMELNARDASTYIRFKTADTERARIDSSGNLLVGGTSAIAGERLYVNGSNANYINRIYNSNASPNGVIVSYTGAAPNGTANEFLRCDDTAAARMSVRSNGGIANYQANNVNLSDRREKTNFSPAGEYLSKICAIPVQTFNYIDQNLEEDAGLTLGVVAQDVQAVAPELVMESNWAKEGEEPKMRLSIYQTDLQYALMKCIQELKAEVDSLKAQLNKGA